MSQSKSDLPRLHIHPNQRYLQTAEGSPFFNPRDGNASRVDAPDSLHWIVQAPVEGPDWVLVIGSATAPFAPPESYELSKNPPQ